METMVDVLLREGGRRWTEDRVYIPEHVGARAIGLTCQSDETGRVCRATLNGVGIHPEQATVLLRDLIGLYYDVERQRFVGVHYVVVGDWANRLLQSSSEPAAAE